LTNSKFALALREKLFPKKEKKKLQKKKMHKEKRFDKEEKLHKRSLLLHFFFFVGQRGVGREVAH
jgi:hypothetical protein